MTLKPMMIIFINSVHYVHHHQGNLGERFLGDGDLFLGGGEASFFLGEGDSLGGA